MTDKERKSCIDTINTLRRLALNIHGVIDVVDNENCERVIAMLENDGWIPVTERLPDKEHTKYVVTLDNGEVENRWWLGCFWVESVGKVIAWKPLSKPYEGSEEE